jgi:hypothetical protein
MIEITPSNYLKTLDGARIDRALRIEYSDDNVHFPLLVVATRGGRIFAGENRKLEEIPPESSYFGFLSKVISMESDDPEGLRRVFEEV